MIQIETDEENIELNESAKNESENNNLSFSNSNLTFNLQNNINLNVQSLNYDLFKQHGFGFNKNVNKLDKNYLVDLEVYKKISKMNVRLFLILLNILN